MAAKFGVQTSNAYWEKSSRSPSSYNSEQDYLSYMRSNHQRSGRQEKVGMMLWSAVVSVLLGSTGNVAGLSKVAFQKVSKSEKPFYCPQCRLDNQENEIRSLREIITALKQEISILKNCFPFNACIYSANRVETLERHRVPPLPMERQRVPLLPHPSQKSHLIL